MYLVEFLNLVFYVLTGAHELGERLSFKYLDGSIPAFHPIAVLNASVSRYTIGTF